MFNQGFYQNSGLIIFTEMILNLFPFLLWFQKSGSISSPLVYAVGFKKLVDQEAYLANSSLFKSFWHRQISLDFLQRRRLWGLYCICEEEWRCSCKISQFSKFYFFQLSSSVYSDQGPGDFSDLILIATAVESIYLVIYLNLK